MGPPSLRLANPIWRPGAINLHPGPKTVQNHRIPGISGRISRKTNENWCAFGHKLMLCLGELLVVVCFRVRLLSRDLLLLLGSRDFAFKCCSQLIIYKYHIFPVRLVGCMLFEAPFVNPRCVGTSAKKWTKSFLSKRHFRRKFELSSPGLFILPKYLSHHPHFIGVSPANSSSK